MREGKKGKIKKEKEKNGIEEDKRRGREKKREKKK